MSASSTNARWRQRLPTSSTEQRHGGNTHAHYHLLEACIGAAGNNGTSGFFYPDATHGHVS
jgi:hypothetical protein